MVLQIYTFRDLGFFEFGGCRPLRLSGFRPLGF